MAGKIGAIWGIAGIELLLGFGVFRLSRVAFSAFSSPFGWYHWLALIFSIVFMAHAEGYRGFQQHFSLRVAARALHLRQNSRISHVILAPLFCAGYFHATRRRKIISCALTFGIIGLVLAVGRLPQPWRGIVDTGVIAGLMWGIISTLRIACLAFRSGAIDCSPELPEIPEANQAIVCRKTESV